jgi:hypothetical protein
MISKNKARLVLSIDREKLKRFKKMAVDQETTLSNMITNALSDTEAYTKYLGDK